MLDTGSPQTPPPPKSLPTQLFFLGAVATLGSAVLVVRLIWEMTALTWRDGPQMVGYSLAHGYGAILFFFPLALVICLLISLGLISFWKIKRRSIARRTWISVAAAALTLAILAIPPTFWDTLFVGKLARSPHAAEFLVYAAATGESAVVHGLVTRGVPINAIDREGETALHTAAATGQTQMVSYLLKRGAPIDMLDLYGDSPLERASASHQTAVVQLLSARGAKDIKGTPEQRNRAS